MISCQYATLLDAGYSMLDFGLRIYHYFNMNDISSRWLVRLKEDFRFPPPLYRWRMRSRIYRWYSQLQALENKTNREEVAANLDEYLTELDGIEKSVYSISVPPPYTEELYHLRSHIEMLRNNLLRAGGKHMVFPDTRPTLSGDPK
jgi:hypothetical protein